jgi:hypothetical protein
MSDKEQNEAKIKVFGDISDKNSYTLMKNINPY